MKYKFKVMAVTAPHWVKLPLSSHQSCLMSNDPFSLQNAIRLAVSKAKDTKSGWNKSNWNSPDTLEESVMLYQYFENQKEDFIYRLKNIYPDLLIINCMTLGFRGAVEIASIAKKIINKDIIIILGGKHVIETTYLINGKLGLNKSCSLYLMKSGLIPKVFDLVISGDGEGIIYFIGELISQQINNNYIDNFFANIEFLKKAEGDWTIGFLDKDISIRHIESEHKILDQNNIPYPIELFVPKSNFPVFGVDKTVHSYSYLSKGCPYNCFYCSEKKSINGKLKQISSGADRLYQQFKHINDYGMNNNLRVSTFVEDSILLGGKITLLSKLRNLIFKGGFIIPFGGQYTIDLLLNKNHQKILKELSNLGLSYFFIGFETNIQEIANRMNKNTNRNISWQKKTEQVLDFLSSLNIKCGFSVMFGIGEKHNDRLDILYQIIDWQKKYGQPSVISLNLATKHPLRIDDIQYLDWGIDPDSKFLEVFTEIFGEASEKYCIDKSCIETIEQLQQIKQIYNSINKKQ